MFAKNPKIHPPRDLGLIVKASVETVILATFAVGLLGGLLGGLVAATRHLLAVA